MKARELHLYRRASGACALAMDGEDRPREFAHLLQALEFIQHGPEFEGIELNVYDAMGNAILKLPIRTLPEPIDSSVRRPSLLTP